MGTGECLDCADSCSRSASKPHQISVAGSTWEVPGGRHGMGYVRDEQSLITENYEMGLQVRKTHFLVIPSAVALRI